MACLKPGASATGGCAWTVLKGIHFELIGRLGIHLKGFNVTAKNGTTPSPSLVAGGKTLTVKVTGGDFPAVVGGAEKEKRARCLGMFQLRRPLYVVVLCETYMRDMRRAFFGNFGGPEVGRGTAKFPGMIINSSYGPDGTHQMLRQHLRRS